MKTNSTRAIFLGALSLMFIFYACSKNVSSSNSSTNSAVPAGKNAVAISMMDGPVNYSKVLIDIQQVAVLIDTSTKQTAPDNDHQWDDNWFGWGRSQRDSSIFWDTLKINPGIYDLLQLRNGTDTLLASGNYPAGKILKIKITLGMQDSVYTDSVTSYPLILPWNLQIFTINVARENVDSIANNDFKLWLDFNLNRSIIDFRGTYYLRPYVVAFNDVQYAKIQGYVKPQWSGALVEAINASTSDTLYAIPNDDGYYMFRGVATGTYTLDFKGENGYQDSTLSGIVVDSAKTTVVPTITLHK